MTYDLFEYPEGKTNYQILNEDNEKTTITLDKWVADILQIELDDVHARLQAGYNKILSEKPELSRRQRGNLIRQMALNTAKQHQDTMKKILGWNTDDILNIL